MQSSQLNNKTIETPEKPLSDSVEVLSKKLFDQYWNLYQDSVYLEKDDILNLYKASQYVLAANLLNYAPAKVSTLTDTSQSLSHEFDQLINNEFKARLLKIHAGSPVYESAQSSLFILEYTQKFNRIYANYNDRYDDIFHSLNHLNYSTNKLNGPLKEFFKKSQIQFPLQYEEQKKLSWKLLINELLGKEVILKKRDSSRSNYPYRIKSSFEFKKYIQQSVKNSKDLEKLTQNYEEFLNQLPMMKAEKSAEGKYFININEYQLDSRDLIIFIDPKTQTEIARLEKSGDTYVLSGYGDDLSIHYEGNINASSLIFNNKNGKIRFKNQSVLSKPLYLSSDCRQFELQGSFASTSSIRVDSRGKIKLPHDLKIYTGDDFQLRTDDLDLEAEITSGNNIQIETRSEFELSNRAKLKAIAEIQLQSKLIKDLRGEISAGSILKVTSADGINVHGAAKLSGPLGISVTARCFNSTDKALFYSDKIIDLNISEQISLDKNTSFDAPILKMNTDKIHLRSPHIKAEKIAISAKTLCKIYPEATLTSSEFTQVQSDNFWLGGKITFGKNLSLRVNKLFVHGVADLTVESLRQSIAKFASKENFYNLEGENIEIVAGVMIGACGSAKAHTKQLSALATIGSEFSVTKNSKKSRLVSLECSVDLPNVNAIYQDLKTCVKKFEKGEYLDALKTCVTWNSLNNGISVARWIVRIVNPPIGKAVDLAWGCLMLLFSLPNLYKECYHLYSKDEKIDACDLIKLMATASGLTTQILNLQTLLDNTIYTGINNNSASSIQSDIPSLVTSFAGLFMPTFTDESLVGVSFSGLSSNGNINRRNILSYEYYHNEIAVSSTHTFERSVQDNQTTMANTVSNMGQSLNRSGRELTNYDAINVQELKESSTILAEQVSWQATRIDEQSNITVNTIQMSGSDSLVHRGNVHARGSVNLSAPELKTTENSSIVGANVGFNGGAILHQGNCRTGEFTFHASGDVVIDKTSQNDVQIIEIQGNNIDVWGNLHFNSLEMQAEDKVDIERPARLEGKQITSVSKSMEIHGHIELEEHEHDHTHTESPDFSISTNEAKIGEDASIHGLNAIMLLKAKNIQDGGKTQLETMIELADEKLDLTPDASHEAATIAYKAESANLSGKTQASDLELNIAHGLDVNKTLSEISSNPNSNTKVSNSLFIETEEKVDLAENHSKINLGIKASDIDLEEKTVSSEKDLYLESTKGNINIKNSYISAQENLTLHSAGETNNDHSSLTGKNLFINSQANINNTASQMIGENHAEIISENGDLNNNGVLNTNVPRSVDPEYQSSEIRGGEGEGYDGLGLNIQVARKLENLGSKIHSEGGLYAEAKEGIENTAFNYTTHPNVLNKTFKIGNISIPFLPILQNTLSPLTVEHAIGSEISGKIVSLHSGKAILNQNSAIQGIETELESKTSVTNRAGLISGSQFVSINAGENIENLCVESNVRGTFDTMKEYHPGIISGGTGENHGGLGLYLHARNCLIFNASDAYSIGDNYFEGDQGIEMTALHHQYISYYKHYSNWCGRESTTIDTSYQLKPCLIYSAKGSNTFVSSMGGIYSVSSQFIAATNNDFSAKESIKFYGLVLQNREFKDKSSLWGASESKTRQVDDYAAPSYIINPGNTQIVSLSDVEMKNASVDTGGKLEVKARNIEITTPTLNHQFDSDSRGFGFSSPLMNPGTSSPPFSDYTAMMNAQNGLEKTLAAWNMALDLSNTSNQLLSNWRNGTSYSMISSFASFSLSYTHQKISSQWQTIANNVGVNAGDMELSAEEKMNMNNGVHVDVSRNAKISAKELNQNGAKLSNSTQSSSQSVSLGISASAQPSFGASASGGVSKSIDYSNQRLNVGGELEITVDHYNLSNANTSADTIKLSTETVSIVSSQSTASSHTWSVSADTNGSVSAANATSSSANIHTASSIESKNGMNFESKTVTLEGGKILAGSGSHIHINQVEAKSVKEYKDVHAYGINGNTNDFSSSSQQQSMGTVGVSVGYEDQRGKQESTIFSTDSKDVMIDSVNGELNTANASGHTMSRDDNFHAQVKIPVYHSNAANEMKENLSWARQRLFSSSERPVDQTLSTFRQSDSLHSKTDIAKTSRLSRWQGNEFSSLKDSNSASVWANELFTSYQFTPRITSPSPYNPDSSYFQRGMGLLQCIGGGFQATGGVIAGVFGAETIIGPVVGGAYFVRGIDNFKTGLSTFLSGNASQTDFGAFLNHLGFSNSEDAWIEGVTDFISPGAIIGGYAKYEKYIQYTTIKSRIETNVSISRAVNDVIEKTGGIYLVDATEMALVLDVSTPPGRAVFWSGADLNNDRLALEFAKRSNRLTLEMTSAGQFLQTQERLKLFDYSVGKIPWEYASERFAKNASGDVFAFVEGSRSTSIFNRIELPILEENTNVVNIIKLPF